MKTILRQMLTADKDSKVYDPIRFGVLLSLFTGLGLVVFSVGWRGQPFDFTQFGAGVGMILAAGGGAMWARKDREAE